VGALKSLAQGLSLLRAIAQTEAVKDARDRVLMRIAEQASRLAQSGLVPKAVSAPAELVAELIVRRPAPPPAQRAQAEAPLEATPLDEPSEPDAPREDVGEVSSAEPADAAQPAAEPPPKKAAARKTPAAKKPSAARAGKKADPASAAGRGKPHGAGSNGGKSGAAPAGRKTKAPAKKVRDKSGDLK
jgi:hypothetical protein